MQTPAHSVREATRRPGPRQRLGLKIRPDILAAAREAARRENRSLSNLVETLLVRYLEQSKPVR